MELHLSSWEAKTCFILQMLASYSLLTVNSKNIKSPKLNWLSWLVTDLKFKVKKKC